MTDLIRRLSLLNIATGAFLIAVGVFGASEYVASLSAKKFFGVVLPILLGVVVLVGLLETKVSGLSWKQTQSLQRTTRPLFAIVAGIAVYLALVILLAPPIPEGIVPFLPKLNFGTALFLAFGVTNALAGLTNLLRAPDPNKWSTV